MKRLRGSGIKELIISACIVLVVAVSIPFLGSNRASADPPMAKDLTGSGLFIELLYLQARCVQDCDWAPGPFTRHQFIDVFAVFKITNRSEVDPKPIYPCNVQPKVQGDPMGWNHMESWVYLSQLVSLDTQSDQTPLTFDDFPVPDNPCASHVQEPTKPEIAYGDSLYVATLATFNVKGDYDVLTVGFDYAGDDEFFLGWEYVPLAIKPFVIDRNEIRASL